MHLSIVSHHTVWTGVLRSQIIHRQPSRHYESRLFRQLQQATNGLGLGLQTTLSSAPLFLFLYTSVRGRGNWINLQSLDSCWVKPLPVARLGSSSTSARRCKTLGPSEMAQNYDTGRRRFHLVFASLINQQPLLPSSIRTRFPAMYHPCFFYPFHVPAQHKKGQNYPLSRMNLYGSWP